MSALTNPQVALLAVALAASTLPDKTSFTDVADRFLDWLDQKEARL